MLTTVSFKDALLGSAKEVFETMVFMALEESVEETRITDDATLLGSITFKGDLEGCLGVCCGWACARSIAANMLGMDPTDELSEDDISDAIGEIANMVMGAVKSRLQNDIPTIEVSIPSVVQGRELKNSLGEGAGKVTITVSVEEEHTMEFSLLFRESAD
jgi:chemotaxis protein CheX